LAGKAKSGKSWEAYKTAIDVADGVPHLGFPTIQGDVLYLGLEDSPRRMRERMRMLAPNRKPNGLLTVETSWPLAGDGGYDQLENWLNDHPAARLVVIDNMRRFEAAGYAYRRDSEIIQRASDMAFRHDICIILVFHLYKGPGVSKSNPDWVDRIQGSVGVSGAADALYGLYRDRNMEDGVLRVTGKDVPEQDIAMRFEPETGTWTRADSPQTLEQQKEMPTLQAALLVAAAMEPGASASDLARAVGRNYNGVKAALWAMLSKKKLVRIEGQYFTPEAAEAASNSTAEVLPLGGAAHWQRGKRGNNSAAG
jgi:hypothetical protein